MSHRDHQDSSTGIAIAILCVLFIVGLAVLGVGGLLYTRTVQVQSRADEAQMMARVAAEARQAEAEATERLTQSREDAAPEDAPRRQLTITMSQLGELTLEGDVVDHDQLSAIFRSAADVHRLQLVVDVDESCAFRNVSELLTLCEKVGIKDVKLRRSETPSETAD